QLHAALAGLFRATAGTADSRRESSVEGLLREEQNRVPGLLLGDGGRKRVVERRSGGGRTPSERLGLQDHGAIGGSRDCEGLGRPVIQKQPNERPWKQGLSRVRPRP